MHGYQSESLGKGPSGVKIMCMTISFLSTLVKALASVNEMQENIHKIDEESCCRRDRCPQHLKRLAGILHDEGPRAKRTTGAGSLDVIAHMNVIRKL